MQTRLDRDFQWNRLAFALLATLILADTAPLSTTGTKAVENFRGASAGFSTQRAMADWDACPL